MFEFYRDCTFEQLSAHSWLTPTMQFISAIIAGFALYIAWVNLRGLKRTQLFQAQTNLINLENQVRTNLATLKLIDYKWKKSGDAKMIDDFNRLTVEKINAFELYISSADKLAALIDSEYLKEQFKNRNWKEEYFDIFSKVIDYHKNEDSIIPGKDKMVNNISNLLKTWSTKK
jgi:hypothetical protein